MVLEIQLTNFFSIKDTVILDLRAGKINTEKSRALTGNTFSFDDIDVLKTVAIYGANASGKSNIIKAIRFCNAMIFESHKHNENTIFNFLPFKFDGFNGKSSTYTIRFVIHGIEYLYSYSLTRNEILKESLYYYPSGRIAKVFERDEKAGKTKKKKYSFGTSVIKRPYDVADSTSNKTLFISRASQMDRAIPKDVFNFFYRDFILHYRRYSHRHVDTLIKNYKDSLLKALQLADSDIIDFQQKITKSKGKNIRANFETEDVSFQDTEVENLEIKTFHKSSPNTPFNFQTEESAGTIKLFWMMLIILDVVKNNKILLIDEIGDSLHVKMIEYIIQIFNAGSQSQLIFSTHNTSILDLDKFRKDQVWFVNKKMDGSSDLYSLYDYGDFRDTMNVEKAYLQGRFDSIPIIDNSKEKLNELIHN